MKNIFLLALATALTIGQAVHAADKPKSVKKAKATTVKVCPPVCHQQCGCGEGCCDKAH